MRNHYVIDWENDVVTITLNRQKGDNLTTIVDLHQLQRLLDFDVKWVPFKHKHSNMFYAIAYVNEDGRRQSYLLHRWVKNCYEWKIQHLNGNGLDNCEDNLHVVHTYTTQLSAGVHYDGKRRKWFLVGKSQPWQRNKRPQRYFDTESEALEMYQRWIEYWKKHAIV